MEVKLKKFKAKSFTIRESLHGNFVTINHQINTAAVKGCYCPSNEPYIFEKVKTHDPDNPEPLFLIECHNHYNAQFWLITDGESWYNCQPVKRTDYLNISKIRLSGRTKLSASVDLSKLSLIDQQIIQAAIAEFFWNGTNNVNSHASSNTGQTSSNQAKVIV